MSDRTPTPVEIPREHITGVHRFGTPGDSPIPITRIHVPLTLWIVASLAMLSGAVSVVATWYRTTEHATQTHVHVDQKAATDGGGVAYKYDVAAARVEAERRTHDEQRRTRRLLRQMTLDCRGTGGRLSCRVNLPEDSE